MTCRAIIWCGTVLPLHRPDVLDAAVSRNDIEMTVSAAHARGVRPENVWALVCNHDLLPVDFQGHVGRADLATLASVSRLLQGTGGPEDGLLFVATNHGDEDGLLVDTDPRGAYDEDDEVSKLSPELLQRNLDSIPGQQNVVIATCFAGVFLPIANERRAVLAACGHEKYTMNARYTPFLYELLRYWAGVNPHNFPDRQPRPLADAFSAAFDADERRAHIQGTPRWPGE